jgi:hypothetical protein
VSRHRRSARAPGMTSAGKAMVVVVAGLLLAGLLNSTAMVRATDNLPPGWRRTAVRAFVVPVDGVARTLRLDRPRARLDTALGRDPAKAGGVRWTGPPRAARQADGPPVPLKATPLPRKAPTKARPLRLLVTGDSMVERLGPILINSIDDGGRVKGDVDVNYGSGLVRLDYFDWVDHAQELAGTPGDVTVFMLGGNDGQSIAAPGGHLQTGTAEWRDEYARRAAEVMDALAAGGRRLYWVGMPMPRSEKMRPMFQSLNAAVRKAADGYPLVTFVDIWADFSPDGRYSDFLPDASGREVKVRARDGIHLSKEGAEMVAAKIRALIRKEWAI